MSKSSKTHKIHSKGAFKYAAATSAAGLAAVTGARAEIVTNDDLGLPGFLVTSENFNWNIDNAGLAEGLFATFNYVFRDLYGRDGFQAAAAGTGALLNLAYGANVSAAPDFQQTIVAIFYGGILANTEGFTSDETGYIGFLFDPTGSQTLYGWAEVVLAEDEALGIFEVVQWAYEDSGSAIAVGSTIPEPKTAALGLGALALGAAGLRRWRKAKADRQAA